MRDSIAVTDPSPALSLSVEAIAMKSTSKRHVREEPMRMVKENEAR